MFLLLVNIMTLTRELYFEMISILDNVLYNPITLED